MADTLLQFWNQQLAIYQAEQTAAQNDLATSQAALSTASTKLAADLLLLDKAGSDIATARAQLAVTTIPADANALIARITQLIIDQRGLQGIVLDDQERASDAQVSIDSANGTSTRAAARAASMQATIAAGKGDADKRESYRAATTLPPVSTLKSDATAFLASATVTHATSRLGKNFPTQIVTIAAKRHDTRINQLKGLQTDLDHALDALATEEATDTGLAGLANQKQIAFQRAQDAVAKYIATASNRFTKAKGVMAMLEAIELDASGTVPDVLSDAEKAQLTALAGTGAAAEGTAEALDTDLNGVFTAVAALDAQILSSIATDVDTLSTDPNIAAKKTAIGSAHTTFTSALAAFVAANKKDLDAWEAVIPDAAWKVLLDFEESMTTLNELSATDPAALVTAMDTAETDLVTALGAAAIAQRRIDYIGDAIAYRQERVDSAQAALAGRLPSAIRGDSY
jgi:hypothetical protein